MAEVRIGHPQQIGPLEVWPVNWGGLSGSAFDVHPFGGSLKFEELTEPEVGTLSISNLGDGDVFIPSGWIIGGDLLQVRTLNEATYVPAGAEIEVAVSCVEQGRWAEGSNPVDGGRAPLSVIAAGRSFDEESRQWRTHPHLRQQSVWRQVHRQERRSGARPTSSLQQIIEEDSRRDTRISRLQHDFLSNLRFEASNDGYLLCLNGEPLLLEVFSQAGASRQVLKSTLKTLSFDVEDQSASRPTDKAQIESFIASLMNETRTLRRGNGRAFETNSGTEQISHAAYFDEGLNLQHLSAINHDHQILIGV